MESARNQIRVTGLHPIWITRRCGGSLARARGHTASVIVAKTPQLGGHRGRLARVARVGWAGRTRSDRFLHGARRGSHRRKKSAQPCSPMRCSLSYSRSSRGTAGGPRRLVGSRKHFDRMHGGSHLEPPRGRHRCAQGPQAREIASRPRYRRRAGRRELRSCGARAGKHWRCVGEPADRARKRRRHDRARHSDFAVDLPPAAYS